MTASIEAMAREAGAWPADILPSDCGGQSLFGRARVEALTRFAALVRAQALEEAARAAMSQVEACAEYTYGHPREKAVEWAKEDKFDSECLKAEELLSIAARAIRALPPLE